MKNQVESHPDLLINEGSKELSAALSERFINGAGSLKAIGSELGRFGRSIMAVLPITVLAACYYTSSEIDSVPRIQTLNVIWNENCTCSEVRGFFTGVDDAGLKLLLYGKKGFVEKNTTNVDENGEFSFKTADGSMPLGECYQFDFYEDIQGGKTEFLDSFAVKVGSNGKVDNSFGNIEECVESR